MQKSVFIQRDRVSEREKREKKLIFFLFFLFQVMSECTFSAPGLHTQFSQKASADHDLAFDTAGPWAMAD